jgi:hypothetical protein
MLPSAQGLGCLLGVVSRPCVTLTATNRDLSWVSGKLYMRGGFMVSSLTFRSSEVIRHRRYAAFNSSIISVVDHIGMALAVSRAQELCIECRVAYAER